MENNDFCTWYIVAYTNKIMHLLISCEQEIFYRDKRDFLHCPFCGKKINYVKGVNKLC